MKEINKVTETYIPNPKEHLHIEPSRVCNLNCKFCAYKKSKRNKQVMPTSLFRNIIDRATAFGYDYFGLTPLTGEVFVDSDFLTKLQYLESHPKVKHYSFFTNYISCHQDFSKHLIKSKKIDNLTISIYG